MLGRTDRHGWAMGHNGGGPGFSTSAWVFDDHNGHRIAAAALVNRDGHDIGQEVVFALIACL